MERKATMSPEENKAQVRQMLTKLWNEQDVNVVDQYVAADYVSHSRTPGIPPNRDGAKQWAALQLKAFPNGKRKIESQIAEDDKVVTRISADLPHEGDFLGIQPTGRTIHVTAIVIHRLDNSKIVEEWMEMDRLDMLQQLGAMQTPGSGS
jgi:predicted ester cyclase